MSQLKAQRAPLQQPIGAGYQSLVHNETRVRHCAGRQKSKGRKLARALVSFLVLISLRLILTDFEIGSEGTGRYKKVQYHQTTREDQLTQPSAEARLKKSLDDTIKVHKTVQSIHSKW